MEAESRQQRPAGMSCTPAAAQHTAPIASRPRTSFLIQDILWDGAEQGAQPERGKSRGFGSQDGEPGAEAVEGSKGSSAPGHPTRSPHPAGASQGRGTPQEAVKGKGRGWKLLAGEWISNGYGWVKENPLQGQDPDPAAGAK